MRIGDQKFFSFSWRLRLVSILIGIAIITSIAFFLSKQQNVRNGEQVGKTINASNSLPSLSLPEKIEASELAYNIQTPAKFISSQKLQNIVNKVVNLTQNKKLPTQPLSITIINPKTGEYGGYQQEKLRYPASVVKIFWMVYLYAQIEKGILSEAEFTQYLDAMINKSDNEASSYIVDKITKTQYHKNIQGKAYQNWQAKRLQINQYFQQAGYNKINVSQKTFPIPSLKLSTAKGSDFKLRGNARKPILNQISTQQVARLLYEIYNNQSISAIYSQKMAQLLTIDAETRNIKINDKNPNEFNPVRGFLSASLPDKINFNGKAGWTTSVRNDAGIITTADGKTAYILVVFAEDSSYAFDWKIFPQISGLVFNQMMDKN